MSSQYSSIAALASCVCCSIEGPAGCFGLVGVGVTGVGCTRLCGFGLGFGAGTGAAAACDDLCLSFVTIRAAPIPPATSTSAAMTIATAVIVRDEEPPAGCATGA